MIFKFILAVIFTEAITELITESYFFSPIRERIFGASQYNRFFDWLHSLMSCGYCFSVWAGCLTAILLFRGASFIHWSVDWFFIGLILHRLSNLFHDILERINIEVQ